MRRIIRSRGRQIGMDQLAITADRHGDGISRKASSPRRNKIETPRPHALSRERFGNVTDWHHAAAAQNHAIQLFRAIREAKHAAGCDELHDLVGGEREAAITQTQQHAGARIELFETAHRLSPASFTAGEVPAATGFAMASSCNSSSLVRKPNGFTTGITFWSSTVKPRYQSRSSLQNAGGNACRRVIVVIFSMPSTSNAARERRSRKIRAAGEGRRPK